MSTYVFDSLHLRSALEQLSNNNTQGEYYITDWPGILKEQGQDIRVLDVLQPCEALSINTFEELRIVEAKMRRMGYRGLNDRAEIGEGDLPRISLHPSNTRTKA